MILAGNGFSRQFSPHAHDGPTGPSAPSPPDYRDALTSRKMRLLDASPAVLFGVLVLAGGGCQDGPKPPTLPTQVTNPTSPRSPSPAPAPAPAPSPVLGGPTGAYIVTLTASPSCDFVRDSVTGETLPFPDTVKVRRYEGEFAEGTGKLKAADANSYVHVGGIDSYMLFGQPLMYVTGTELTIIVPGNLSGVPENYAGGEGGCAGGDYWGEQVLQGDFNFFELCGTWRGSMENPAQIDGTIDGGFLYGEGPGYAPRRRQFCRASDHRFAMVRR
jgi:hypothetical protein